MNSSLMNKGVSAKRQSAPLPGEQAWLLGDSEGGDLSPIFAVGQLLIADKPFRIAVLTQH